MSGEHTITAMNAIWAEPGGDNDPDNPNLHVPATVRKLIVPARRQRSACGSACGRCFPCMASQESSSSRSGVKSATSDALADGSDFVSNEEIDWMAQQRDLVLCRSHLVRDYGSEEAEEILRAIGNASMPEAVAGALAWPGVGTRWQRFIAWWRQLDPAQRPEDARGALAGFARAVGRVCTFRALALDKAGIQRIFQEDEIFPSGRLHQGVDAARLRSVVEEHGVAKVAVVRLYIEHMTKMLGIDPSISLHDDWQTTCLIASGYASGNKRVHLFELSVPAVESLGWTLWEVASRAQPILGNEYSRMERWFRFGGRPGCWFDATSQRTERYGLYSVPHLRQRLRNLYIFDSVSELSTGIAPFVTEMSRRYEEGSSRPEEANVESRTDEANAEQSGELPQPCIPQMVTPTQDVPNPEEFPKKTLSRVKGREVVRCTAESTKTEVQVPERISESEGYRKWIDHLATLDPLTKLEALQSKMLDLRMMVETGASQVSLAVTEQICMAEDPAFLCEEYEHVFRDIRCKLMEVHTEIESAPGSRRAVLQRSFDNAQRAVAVDMETIQECLRRVDEIVRIHQCTKEPMSD